MFAMLIVTCGLAVGQTPYQVGTCALSNHRSIFYTEAACMDILANEALPMISKAIPPNAAIAFADCVKVGEAENI